MVRTAVQVIGRNAIFSLSTKRILHFSHKAFAYLIPYTYVTAFLLFKKCYLNSHKNVIQNFSFPKPGRRYLQ